MSTYTAVPYTVFADTMKGIGFEQINLPGTEEYVWERQVVTTGGKVFPYRIRIYSTIDCDTSCMRDCGNDAVRVVLVRQDSDRPMRVEQRVNRVGDRIMERVVERARELFRYTIDPNNYCPECGGLLVPRKSRRGKFVGCSNYPTCSYTR